MPEGYDRKDPVKAKANPKENDNKEVLYYGKIIRHIRC